MHWGYDITDEHIKMTYVDEPWFHADAPFTETFTREESQLFTKRDTLWSLKGDTLTRVYPSQETYKIDPAQENIYAADVDSFYVCQGKQCWRASNQSYTLYKTFISKPSNIIVSEGGLLYKTANGYYTPEHEYLTRELHKWDTHEGVFVGTSAWGLKIWYIASWEQHHRIQLPAAAIDIACTVPWVSVLTKKNTCSIFNVHSGEAYRQWSLNAPLGVAIDQNAQVTVLCGDELCFYDDAETCIFAQKCSIREAYTSNDTMWVVIDNQVRKIRQGDTWPLQVCMWCEAPLSVPFPAPPAYVLKSVENIIHAFQIFWQPKSYENVSSERRAEHAKEFSQIINLNEWSRGFFSYAAERKWNREKTIRALIRLRSMRVEIDRKTWADVDNRIPNKAAFDLWDILYDDIDDSACPIITLACTYKQDAWITGRAEECAKRVVHPYLLSFLPLRTFIDVLEHLWVDWAPVVVEWCQRTSSLDALRKLKLFTRGILDQGPVEVFPSVMQVYLDMNLDFHPHYKHMQDVALDFPTYLKKYPQVVFDMVSPMLHIVGQWNYNLDQPHYISVCSDHDMCVWGDRFLFRHDRVGGISTKGKTMVPIHVSNFRDTVVCVQPTCIEIYTYKLSGVVRRFDIPSVLYAFYEDEYRLWVLHASGVLECIHAVNGRILYTDETVFKHVRKMRKQGDCLHIISDDMVFIYHMESHTMEEYGATHVHDVLRVKDKYIFVYEDNSLCYEGSTTTACSTEYRPLFTYFVHGHIIILTTLRFFVYDTEWNKLCTYEFHSTLVDAVRVDTLWYILLRDGTVTALRWNQSNMKRVQETIMSMDAAVLQKYASKVLDIFLINTSLHDHTMYVETIRTIMEDRTTWPLFIREDVLKWFIDLFCNDMTSMWSIIWPLYSFRAAHKCAICQSSSVSETQPLCILTCGHRFHTACIDQLVRSHEGRNRDLRLEYALEAELACPVCRHPISHPPVPDREMTLLCEYDSDS